MKRSCLTLFLFLTSGYLWSQDLNVNGVTTSKGLRVPNRFAFGQSESALEIEIPNTSYNAIRGFRGSQIIGTIHWFDLTWGSSSPANSAGSINIDATTAVTIGGWNDQNTGTYFRRSDGNVGIGTAYPFSKLSLPDGAASISLGNNIFLNGFGGTGRISNNAYLNSNETWSIYDTQAKASTIELRDNGKIEMFGTVSTGQANWKLMLTVDAPNDRIIMPNGNVGIGTTAPDSKLTVKGVVHAEEVKVDLSVPGPDYVFADDYPLRSLEDTKTYIDQYKHLPGIPSSDEMQLNGVNLLEMNMKLLEKVEELTLHLIEMKKIIHEQDLKIDSQQRDINQLKSEKQ